MQADILSSPPLEPAKPNQRGLLGFFCAMLALVCINLVLSLVIVPERFVLTGSLLLSLFTVGLPIFALYLASTAKWTPKLGLGFLIGGILCQVLFESAGIMVNKSITSSSGIIAVLLLTISQVGLLTWCLGIGGLVATIIKDRNMLLPVAIVLAAMDAFLVLSPFGFTRKLVKQHPRIIEHIGYQVGSIHHRVSHVPLRAMVFIGPADFLFLGMFFIALHKFGMQTRRTFAWVAPVLLLYLMTVAVFGGMRIGPITLNMLPALLPIGLVVILTNIGEWKMVTEEKVITFIIFLLAIGLVAFGFLHHPVAEPQAQSDGGGFMQRSPMAGPNPPRNPSNSNPNSAPNASPSNHHSAPKNSQTMNL